MSDKYVWILHYGGNEDWMDQATADNKCSKEEIQSAAHAHYVTRDVTVRMDDETTMSGKVRILVCEAKRQ